MSTINTTINQLNAAASAIVLVVSIINFVLGVVGQLLNLLVFTRPTLRREPCTLYFLSSTCFNLFIVFIVIPVRILANAFGIDQTDYNIGLCKIENFTFFMVRPISCWLIAFACVDRFLHSSTNVSIRRWSSLKTARISIGIIIVAMAILYSHMIVYYEISYITNQYGNIVPSCNAQKGIYRNFNTIWHTTFYSLCPSFLMIFFGSLTLKNIRQRRLIHPVVGGNNRIGRRTDSQLLRMLTAQVFIIIISTLPYSICRLYVSFTANVSKDTLRIAQENLASQIVGVMRYFAHASSFYLYTLTGVVFRKELFKIITRHLPMNRHVAHIHEGRTIQISVLQNNRQETPLRTSSNRQ
ncbi:unnamed protein product [Adineta steineri]|uniref:G-protein coupled receptors family 1 profile domain-containing protein n=1 Tax=Adineta steineri TaxID=433720 RepID=A0A816E3N9_9BILA|nr:unnamed protein product [Adineta steineri]CAF1645398.1 unnamed protein product [Adineta steineri]